MLLFSATMSRHNTHENGEFVMHQEILTEEINPVSNNPLQPYQYIPAVACDTETQLMETGKLIPPLVCMAVSAYDAETQIVTDVTPVMNKDQLDGNINYLLQAKEQGFHVVFANASFDLAVLCFYRPEIIPAIFQMLEEGLIEDVLIRERLLHLSTHGQLDFMDTEDEDGESTGGMKLKYSLNELGKRYLGKDRGGDKEENDAWRKNYAVLESYALDSWPAEAIRYVSEDAEDTLAIREIQEQERVTVWKNIAHDPFKTQGFQVACSFALHLVSAWGMVIDPVEFNKIVAMLKDKLKPDNMKLMLAAGVLRPAEPPRPYAKAKNADGTPKMTKGKEESIDTKVFRDYIVKFCEANKIEVIRTAPTDKYPEGQVSYATKFLKAHAHKDPLLTEYYERQKLSKLVSTEIPRMSMNKFIGLPEGSDPVPAPLVHPCFNVLVSTGRTSSFASKLYASTNGQNLDPRVRPCFTTRPGYLMFSIDYNQMELGTAAQTCFDLFGHSVLKDKINAGIDVHTYLGAQLAYHLHPDFKKSCDEVGATDADQIFEAFMKCKKHSDPAVQKFFAHYRKFAKPTGLGYPGGLGAETFIEYAKATYDVDVDLATAKLLKEIWLSTFPEFRDYFKWITTSCADVVQADKFCYVSPLGMYRAGANFCATANGKALQTPSAEGAKMSVFNIVRACIDPTLGSILLDDKDGPQVRLTVFVHDENIGEIRAGDGSYEARKHRHELLMEMARIMVESMRVVTPDVTPRANPVLMTRWDKRAEPVFDKDGFLDVWMPPKK